MEVEASYNGIRHQSWSLSVAPNHCLNQCWRTWFNGYKRVPVTWNGNVRISEGWTLTLQKRLKILGSWLRFSTQEGHCNGEHASLIWCWCTAGGDHNSAKSFHFERVEDTSLEYSSTKHGIKYVFKTVTYSSESFVQLFLLQNCFDILRVVRK